MIIFESQAVAEGFATTGCSFAADGQGSYAIIGTEGAIDVPRGIIPGLGTRAAEGLIVVIDPDGNRREELFEPANQYKNIVDAIAEAVLKKQPVPLPPEDGLDNLKVLEALVRSSARKAVENISAAVAQSETRLSGERGLWRRAIREGAFKW